MSTQPTIPIVSTAAKRKWKVTGYKLGIGVCTIELSADDYNEAVKLASKRRVGAIRVGLVPDPNDTQLAIVAWRQVIHAADFADSEEIGSVTR